MIDHIVIDISKSKDIESRILSHKDLNFINEYDLKTTTLKRRIAIHKKTGLVFSISNNNRNPSGKINIKGSLHQASNMLLGKGRQNFNEFTFEALFHILEYLHKEFGFVLKTSKIRSMEFGYNLSLDGIRSSDVIRRNIKLYKCQSHNSYDDFKHRSRNKGCQKVWRFFDHDIKIYDTTAKHGKVENKLRIEVRAKKARYLNKMDIEFLSDLFDLEKLKLLELDIKKKFSQLTIVDAKTDNVIKVESDKKLFNQCLDPEFWINQEPFKRTGNAFRQSRTRFRKRLSDILEKYNLNSIYSRLMRSLESAMESTRKVIPSNHQSKKGIFIKIVSKLPSGRLNPKLWISCDSINRYAIAYIRCRTTFWKNLDIWEWDDLKGLLCFKSPEQLKITYWLNRLKQIIKFLIGKD